MTVWWKMGSGLLMFMTGSLGAGVVGEGRMGMGGRGVGGCH